MKVYEGERGLSGALVTVDGIPLLPRTDLARFNRTGFEWSYAGPGPKQLSLAMLADYLGDDARALTLAEPFMHRVVTSLDNAWRLTSSEIEAELAGMA